MSDQDGSVERPPVDSSWITTEWVSDGPGMGLILAPLLFLPMVLALIWLLA